ncbi:MAG: SH3 domain-containing protein, partial [Anaerolineae bacterium]|nr:SH3 domain-containing protein [Anaerolineae bacterium]
TEYRINRFEGTEESFNLAVEVQLGQTIQRVNRLLDANSSYDVTTPSMTLAARGTNFSIRVEPTGRAAMLVSEGNVNAASDASSSDVPAEFGIRSVTASSLSDVVRAKTFDELDAAIDGCAASVETQDDVRINVRIGAGLDFARIGTLDPAEVTRFMGVIESGEWYRITFRGGYGWMLSSSAAIEENCAGLRKFPDGYGPEDASLFTSLGDEISLNAIITPEATETPSD